MRLVSQHGSSAVAVARARALSAMQDDRQPDYLVWAAVSEAAQRFLKLIPDDGEWLN